MAAISNLQHVKGDLITFDVQYRAHQCNAVSTYAVGIAKSIFTAKPEADIYTGRKVASTMGTIDVRGDVINMIAQYYPGKAKGSDNSQARLQAFRSCLIAISQIQGLKSVAFPFNIGCGYGGGCWADYLALLEEFAQAVPSVQVYTVSL